MPGSMGRYRIGELLLREAEEAGVSPGKLRQMIERSTRITHPFGNRRFHDYIFRVHNDEVLVIVLPTGKTLHAKECRCTQCMDTQRVAVYDECPRCEGKGCKRCVDGFVQRMVPCPMCSKGRVVTELERSPRHGKQIRKEGG